MIRNLIVGLSLGLVLVAILSPVQAQDLEDSVEQLTQRIEALEKEQAGSSDFKLYWKNGIRFDTPDKAFQMRIGGRIMADTAWFDQDSDLERELDNWQDATEFRRARLYIQGLINKNIEFKAQYDFAGGDADFKDVYLGYKGLPIGGLRVGHFKEPFSLEELTSSKYITFMERALPNVFAPSRNMGAMVHNHILDDRATYALGVFRDTDGFGEGAGDGKYNITGRLTGLPWYEDKGSKLLHLGVGCSYRNPNDDDVRYRQRPEAHLSPDRLVDTSDISADTVNVVGAEAALVYGPASLQGEYITADVDGRYSDSPDPDLAGYYIQASYFLTGENRAYKASGGNFDRVKPKKNLSKEGGWGAWELAARYSHLDLEDDLVNGGELDTVTAGVNWYLNPNTRVMLNYVFADAEDKYEGEADILQMRFQVDF